MAAEATMLSESWRVWRWGAVIFLIGLVIALAVSRVPGYVVMTIGGVMLAWFGPRSARSSRRSEGK
jgi:uncharacterized membrane protein